MTENYGQYIKYLCDRYQIPAVLFNQYQIYLANSKDLFMVSKNHHPNADIKAEASGINLLSINNSHLKLKTAAVKIVGRWAGKNFVNLTRQQLNPYFNRQTIDLKENQLISIDRLGYVIVKYLGQGVGMGQLKFEQNRYVLISLFPRGWA